MVLAERLDVEVDPAEPLAAELIDRAGHRAGPGQGGRGLVRALLLEPLTAAVSAGTLTLARVDTGAVLPIAITQPVGPGLSSPRRLVVKLTSEEESWPETGTLLQVTLPAAALVDLFGNVATSGAAESFAWKAGDTVLDDAVAPRVQRVCVSGGHLEIELSEEPQMADVATAIQVNGAPITWTRAGGGYLLVSADVLPAGSYTLSIGTQALDLAGLGLAESFQRSFTLSAGKTRKQIYLRSLPGFASTSTIGNLFGFHGQPLDPETGLVYIRNRYYDPELGRFIATDPMGYGDGPNLYQYGLNNPANFSDPTGEYVESAIDLASLGIGVASLLHNLDEENYGAALLDTVGIALDAIALAVPLVPGVAGVALKASRAAGQYGGSNPVFANKLIDRVTTRMQADHIWELQLTGPDISSNLRYLDTFTNQDIGMMQIWPQIRKLPVGTRIKIKIVGRDETVIREYIKNQEKEDERLDQLSLWR